MHKYKFAGFWWRFLAYLIDTVFLIAINSSVGMVLGMMGFILHIKPFGLGLMSFSAGIVLTWLYYTIFESSPWQGTIGKKICGLIVIDLNGRRISFGRANGRYFAKFLSSLILCVGFFMIGWTEKKQGLHDMIAGTLVLRRNPVNNTFAVPIPTP